MFVLLDKPVFENIFSMAVDKTPKFETQQASVKLDKV